MNIFISSTYVKNFMKRRLVAGLGKISMLKKAIFFTDMCMQLGDPSIEKSEILDIFNFLDFPTHVGALGPNSKTPHPKDTTF